MNWSMLVILIGSILIFIGVFGYHWLMIMIGLGLIVTAIANITFITTTKNKYNSKL